MFLSSLFQKNENNISEGILLLDLGSGSVGALFLIQNQDGTTRVLHEVRKEFPLQEKVTLDRFLVALRGIVSTLLDEILASDVRVVPKQVLVSVASPWHTSQTRVVHFEQHSDFLVTYSSVWNLVQKESEAFMDTSKGIGGIFEHSFSIEPQVMQVKLNGYESENPIGKYAKIIDVAVHYAAIPESLNTLFLDEVTKRISGASLSYVTYMFGASVVARDVYAGTPSFLVVDLAAEVTDVGLIHDGVLVETISYPFGSRSLVRSISSGLSISPNIAESELRAHMEGHLIGERAKKIDTILELSTMRWNELFTEAIGRFSEKYPLPTDLFLITQPFTKKYFSNEIVKPIVENAGNIPQYSNINLKVKDFTQFLLPDCKDPFLCVMIVLYKKQLSSKFKRI